MGLVDEMKKLSSPEVALVILGFAGGLAPGVLIVYLFRQDLFLSLSISKLVLFSFSLTTPQIIVSSIFFFGISKPEENVSLSRHFAYCLVGSFSILYFLILVSYFLKTEFKTFLELLLEINAGLIIMLIIKKGRKTKKK